MEFPTLTHPALEYGVIAAYLVLMVSIGLVFRGFNKNDGDYFRSGSQATWWMVGVSSFMAGVSALTFTGNGGAAFQAGWSVIWFYVGNLAGLVLNIFFLAPWFRQMRATTLPEVIRERFGPATQQVYAYVYMFMFLIMGAIWLYGLAIFAGSAFNLPIHLVIPVLGAVVIFYSTLGGKWAVLAADFVQGVIMVSMTILLSILCLNAMGGVGEFFEGILAKGLTEDFAVFKPAGRFAKDAYTWEWGLAAFIVQIAYYCSAASAVKYFAVKDGREARKAALLTAVLMLAGIIFWFIPPMAARLLIEDQVLLANMAKPEEASFAAISLHLLPNGLVGLMVVAIFSATMSSMDAGLNTNAAMCVRDALPPIFRILRKPVPSDRANLWIGWGVTFLFGILIVSIAQYFARQERLGIFEIMVNFTALVGMPATIPLVLCLFVRRVPPWAALFSLGCAMIPSALSLLNPEAWNFQSRTFWVFLAGVAGFLATRPFWKHASPAYRQRVDGFFEKMHRPVDYAREVGESTDTRQLAVMGRFSLAISAGILLLLLMPNSASDRLWILGLALTIAAIGALLCRKGSPRPPQ